MPRRFPMCSVDAKLYFLLIFTVFLQNMRSVICTEHLFVDFALTGFNDIICIETNTANIRLKIESAQVYLSG